MLVYVNLKVSEKITLINNDNMFVCITSKSINKTIHLVLPI